MAKEKKQEGNLGEVMNDEEKFIQLHQPFFRAITLFVSLKARFCQEFCREWVPCFSLPLLTPKFK